MSGTSRARWVGDGVAKALSSAALARGASAQVVGVFRSGFYVRAGAHVFAVGHRHVAPGPLHLVLTELPTLPKEGDSVCIQKSLLHAGAVAIDLSYAQVWSPTVPTKEFLTTALPILARMNWFVPEDVASRWTSLKLALGANDLERARELLQGVGGGLTPTGDDVFAGILLMDCWCNPLSERAAQEAKAAITTDLSRAFLHWAARGQSILHVHNLLSAAHAMGAAATDAKASASSRLRHAFDRVAQIGSSSGMALLAGLGLAADFCQPPS